MMVIDTMIVCYALLNEKQFGKKSLLALESADEIIAPDMIRPEIANAVWQWVSWANVTLDVGLSILKEADQLIDEVVPSNQLWYHAIELSHEKNHSVYDTLFIALARLRKTKLITNDKKLKNKFDHDVVLLEEYLVNL